MKTDEIIAGLARMDKHLSETHAEYGVEVVREAAAKIAAMRFALTHAAETFRKYEALHRAKGTADGTTKANSNMIIAKVCEDALGVVFQKAGEQ